MRVNKYPGTCVFCRTTVPRNGGKLQRKGKRWVVAHLACAESQAPQVTSVTFNSGETVTVNSNGRCIDAPCCGCCS